MVNKRHQVFLSSTYEDLIEERRALMQNLITNDYIPAGMESFPAAPNPPWALIEHMMDDSDYYVLVIGKSYGTVDGETSISFTHREYKEARRRGNMPILAFLIDSNSQSLEDGRLAAFRREVESDQRTFKRWSDKTDLANKVVQALNDARKSTPRDGWIRQRDALVSRDVRAIRDDISQVRNHIESIDATLDQTLESLRSASNRLDEAVKMSEAIHSYKTMLRNKELLDPIYRHAADKLMEMPLEILRGLSEARLHVRGEWIGTLFDVLATGVTKRYDGVSSDDLKWWLDERNFSAVRYLTRNKQLVDDGKTATRLFILNRQKLLRQKDRLHEVLDKHEDLGIGWAVAIEEHLTPAKFRNFDIDFGLFDENKVVSFFHNYSEVSKEPRRFDVFFNTYGRFHQDGGGFRDNDDIVERHLRGYRSLVQQCRLVSRRFVGTHIGASERRESFRLIAETPEEIPMKINALVELDRGENRRSNGRKKVSD